jgi:hypothetical protein
MLANRLDNLDGSSGSLFTRENPYHNQDDRQDGTSDNDWEIPARYGSHRYGSCPAEEPRDHFHRRLVPPVKANSTHSPLLMLLRALRHPGPRAWSFVRDMIPASTSLC